MIFFPPNIENVNSFMLAGCWLLAHICFLGRLLQPPCLCSCCCYRLILRGLLDAEDSGSTSMLSSLLLCKKASILLPESCRRKPIMFCRALSVRSTGRWALLLLILACCCDCGVMVMMIAVAVAARRHRETPHLTGKRVGNVSRCPVGVAAIAFAVRHDGSQINLLFGCSLTATAAASGFAALARGLSSMVRLLFLLFHRVVGCPSNWGERRGCGGDKRWRRSSSSRMKRIMVWVVVCRLLWWMMLTPRMMMMIVRCWYLAVFSAAAADTRTQAHAVVIAGCGGRTAVAATTWVVASPSLTRLLHHSHVA